MKHSSERRITSGVSFFSFPLIVSAELMVAFTRDCEYEPGSNVITSGYAGVPDTLSDASSVIVFAIVSQGKSSHPHVVYEEESDPDGEM